MGMLRENLGYEWHANKHVHGKWIMIELVAEVSQLRKARFGNLGYYEWLIFLHERMIVL